MGRSSGTKIPPLSVAHRRFRPVAEGRSPSGDRFLSSVQLSVSGARREVTSGASPRFIFLIARLFVVVRRVGYLPLSLGRWCLSSAGSDFTTLGPRHRYGRGATAARRERPARTRGPTTNQGSCGTRQNPSSLRGSESALGGWRPGVRWLFASIVSRCRFNLYYLHAAARSAAQDRSRLVAALPATASRLTKLRGRQATMGQHITGERAPGFHGQEQEGQRR
jgi:hypothetical protein